MILHPLGIVVSGFNPGRSYYSLTLFVPTFKTLALFLTLLLSVFISFTVETHGSRLGRESLLAHVDNRFDICFAKIIQYGNVQKLMVIP